MEVKILLDTSAYSGFRTGVPAVVKKKNITENTSGMIHIIFACTGSGGVGLSQV